MSGAKTSTDDWWSFQLELHPWRHKLVISNNMYYGATQKERHIIKFRLTEDSHRWSLLIEAEGKKKKKKRLECDRKFSLLNFTASSFAWKKWSHARTHTRLVPSVYTKNLRWFHYLWAPSDILWALHGIGLGLSERDKRFLSFMFFKFYDVAKLPTCGVKTEPLRLPVKGRREPWI